MKNIQNVKIKFMVKEMSSIYVAKDDDGALNKRPRQRQA